MNDLNIGFYKDLDTNFTQALEMSERNFSHEELIELLKNGNIPQKQIAALVLDYIADVKEADILISNLTGCDGKIREAVALKINSLLLDNEDNKNYFTQADVFADASIDINANICRLVIDSVNLLKDNKLFLNIYQERILQFIQEAFGELDKFIFRDKKYVINKQLFKLYWALEAMKVFAENVPREILYSILDRASQEREYTIREKAAQIIKKLQIKDLEAIVKRLTTDENYYVRKAISD